MKRILSLTLTLVLLLGLCTGLAFADGTNVYVTIVDKSGNLVLVQEKTAVTDIDADGKITVNDALYCAHEAKFEGGAAAGYLSEVGDYGLSLKKLWGTDNGTGYGYYVNNAAAYSLADEVKDGSYIVAFIYTDTETWSDTFCYFDKNTVSGKAGDKIDLTLTSVGFDASYNTVLSPVAGASILVNGKAVDAKTDGDGKVSITLSDAGTYTISAKSDSIRLVAPACVATIAKAEQAPVDTPVDTPKTGDTMTIVLFALLAVSALAVIVIVAKRRKDG